MNKVIVGIDISKKTFDASFKNAQNKWKHSSFENITQGFNKFREWLSQNNIKDIHIIIDTHCVHNVGLKLLIWAFPSEINCFSDSRGGR